MVEGWDNYYILVSSGILSRFIGIRSYIGRYLEKSIYTTFWYIAWSSISPRKKKLAWSETSQQEGLIAAL